MFDIKEFNRSMDLERKKQADELAEYLSEYIKLNASIKDMKINNFPSTEVIEKIKNTNISREGRNPKEVADELIENVLSKSMLIQHPRFFSFVASAVSPYSLAGSILTDVYNIHGGGYEEAPGATIIEEKLVKYMGSRAGYPDTCGGVFTSGGSMSNFTALIAARDKILKDIDYSKGVAYVSDQTHSSLVKGLRMIGIKNEQIRIIETDDRFKIQPKLVIEQIEKDISNGLRPFVIVGTIGTTNTGSIDPLNDLADIKDKYNMWLHVDGAYGGSILFSDIYRNLAKGVERSDSISWDTHKWAMQTYSCSTIIARDKNDLLNSFVEHPEYLADISSKDHDDGWDLGPEMSRPHRAIKLWYTIQALGTDKLADIIDYGFYNSKIAQKELLKNDDIEIVSEPSCAAITFRYLIKEVDPKYYDEFNARISKRIIEDGYCFIVTTVIKNKKVLRMCFVNGNTTTEDVISSIEYINKVEKEIKEDFIKNIK